MHLKESVTLFEKATHKEWAKADLEKVKIMEKFSSDVLLELIQMKLFTIYVLL